MSCRMSAEEASQRLITDIDADEEDMQEIRNEKDVTDEYEAIDDGLEVEKNENEEEEDHSGCTSDVTVFGVNEMRWKEVKIGGKDSRRCQWQNIITCRLGATAFIMNRANNELDIFLELLGRGRVRKITAFSVEESRRQNNSRFSLTKDELLDFPRLCIAWGLLQDKNEPICNLWSKKYGRDIFCETMSRDRFLPILKYLLMTNQHGPGELWINLRLLEICGNS